VLTSSIHPGTGHVVPEREREREGEGVNGQRPAPAVLAARKYSVPIVLEDG